MTPADRLFATVPETASALASDQRTVRSAIAAGEIPAIKVGAAWRIPLAWLREQARVAIPASPPAPPAVSDDLADAVADRIFARIALALGTRAPGRDP